MMHSTQLSESTCVSALKAQWQHQRISGNRINLRALEMINGSGKETKSRFWDKNVFSHVARLHGQFS